MLMTTTQISKIQLRRGKQTELDPGTLDDGELGFATDTGRLFIGTDPTEIGIWTDRATLPYDSLEILTETSIDTFARLHDRMERMIGPVGMVEAITARRPYVEGVMPANTTSWTPFSIFRSTIDGAIDENITDFLVLAHASSISAELTYFIFDGNKVFRSGTMHVMHDGNTPVDEAVMADDYVADFQVSATGTPILVNTLFGTGLRFRVMRIAGTDPTFVLQFKNETTKLLRMQLRVMVAAKPSV